MKINGIWPVLPTPLQAPPPLNIQFCSESSIDEHWTLTTARCVAGISPGDRVFLSDTDALAGATTSPRPVISSGKWPIHCAQPAFRM